MGHAPLWSLHCDKAEITVAQPLILCEDVQQLIVLTIVYLLLDCLQIIENLSLRSNFFSICGFLTGYCISSIIYLPCRVHLKSEEFSLVSV